eukprot:1601652-Pyramimonas_sp.AAC.1
MQGGWLSQCGSRLSAVHIRFKSLDKCQGWKAAAVQNVALALASRHSFQKSHSPRGAGLLKPFLPLLVGRIYPSPYPLHWVWTGRPTRG